MNYQDIARDALSFLDRDGWCKDSLGEPFARGKEHCVGGALNLALSGGKQSIWADWGWAADDEKAALLPVYERLAAIMRVQFPGRVPDDYRRYDAVMTIVAVNNHDDTVEAEMRLSLEKLGASDA